MGAEVGTGRPRAGSEVVVGGRSQFARIGTCYQRGTAGSVRHLAFARLGWPVADRARPGPAPHLTVFPFLLSIYVSLTGWQPQFGDWWQAEITFPKNYVDLLTADKRFHYAVARTLLISVVCLSLEFLLGLLLAVTLAGQVQGPAGFCCRSC